MSVKPVPTGTLCQTLLGRLTRNTSMLMAASSSQGQRRPVQDLLPSSRPLGSAHSADGLSSRLLLHACLSRMVEQAMTWAGSVPLQ